MHVAEQVNQVGAVRRTLERRLGREPESTEIADEMGLEEERVLDLMRFGRDHVSLDAPIEEDGDTALGDLIARETARPGRDGAGCRGSRPPGRHADALDERSADVVRRRYGLLDGRQAKLADIGAVWGITAERVRQIERHAIAKLRSPLVSRRLSTPASLLYPRVVRIFRAARRLFSRACALLGRAQDWSFVTDSGRTGSLFGPNLFPHSRPCGLALRSCSSSHRIAQMWPETADPPSSSHRIAQMGPTGPNRASLSHRIAQMAQIRRPRES